ncbi:hypothetical protein C8Q76DRAFT_466923 [Earliella scabrosa]|nr:hypothetical protein C8Q76DRAFT_466923 [Earliella scabrosa]
MFDNDTIATSTTPLAPEDWTAVSQLGAAAVQSWIVARIDEYTTRIHALKSAYNAAAPINRTLPAEILMEVFAQLQPSRLKNRGTSLLHVCRLWRSLLFRTPEFWVDWLTPAHNMIKAGEDYLERFATSLELTRTHSVKVSLIGLPSSALRILSPHAQRLASLSVTIAPEDVDNLNALLTAGSTPSLAALAVRHRRPLSNAETRLAVCLQAQCLPNLHSLSHPANSFTIDSIAPQLRHIDLFRCTCRTCNGGTEEGHSRSLPELLQLCVSLETLRLQQALSFFPDRSGSALTLPLLRRLEITDDKHQYTKLLSTLTLPVSCFLQIADPRSYISLTFREGLPVDLLSSNQICAADEVRYLHPGAPRSAGVLETHAQGVKRMRLEVPDPDFARSLTDVREIFAPFGNLTALTIAVSNRHIRTKPDFYLLVRFPQLRRLHLGQCDTRHVITILGEAQASGGCLCPHLEELHVMWRHSDDETFEPTEAWKDVGGGGVKWHLYGPAVFAKFCKMVVYMLQRRSSLGSPLKRLSVGILPDTASHYQDEEQWDPPALMLRLRERSVVGSMLEDVRVVCVDD